MVAASRPASRPAARRLARVRVLGASLRRSAVLPQRVALLLLALAAAGIGLLSQAAGPDAVPASLLVLPLLAGGLLLGPFAVRLLLLVTALVILYDVLVLGVPGVRPLSLLSVVATGAFALQLARVRARLGISGARSEALLLELRDRLHRHGDLPELPAGWHADSALRSAGGGTLGGDFLVAARRGDGRRLEVALVDVSGKGVEVASRALLLSGALAGLLGAVPPDRFLDAANDYLYRQGWEEGFATAAYVALDLVSGCYTVRSAGHPPVAAFQSGSGRWVLSRARGPVLGVLPETHFAADEGVLRRHDALLLYTDGLIEIPGRALSVGIDRLLGAAERLVPYGFAGGADRLVTAVAPKAADDRALLLIWRD